MSNDLQDRLYQLVFIWLKDPDGFARYLERLRPIAERHRTAAERLLVPESIHAFAMPMPDAVNLVHYPSRDAFRAFHDDPDFREIMGMRTESIDMAQVTGPSLGGEPSADAAGRTYVVEVARRRSTEAYRAYEAAAKTLLARHGHRVERSMAPQSATGFPFEPDVVRIASFNPGSLARMHEDPAHAAIEEALYPDAVEGSIWVVGSART